MTVSPAVSPAVSPSSRPELARHIRLTFDPTRRQHVLLRPETVVVLNATGADILGLCDGRRSVADIVTTLQERYQRVVDDEVQEFLALLVARRYVEIRDG